MKTQIIQLEPHDDYVSIRDKMSWSKTPRILLVWPVHGRVSLRLLDLKLIQRHAGFLGARLGLVTNRAEVKGEAMEFDIPFFSSTTIAQRETWETERPHLRFRRRGQKPDLKALRNQIRPLKSGLNSHPVFRLLFFTIGVLAALVVGAAFIPRANITLTPISHIQAVTLPVVANKKVQRIYLTGSVPAHEVRVLVDGSQTIAATGSTVISLDKASGFARFRNLTDARVFIPSGTIIRTQVEPVVRFITMQAGEVAPGIDQTADLPIYAMDPGVGGNLNANELQAIEGSLGLSLAVTNPEHTTGGREQLVMAPSPDDRERVKNLLLTSLIGDVKTRSHNTLSTGDIIFSDTIQLSQIREETYSPPEGQPGSKLTIKMQVEYIFFYTSHEDLIGLARAVLSTSTPEGLIPIPDTLNIILIDKPVTDDTGLTRWQMRFEQQYQERMDIFNTIQMVQGRTLKNASRQLEGGLPISKTPLITLTPTWWPWLPIAPFRISVIIA